MTRIIVLDSAITTHGFLDKSLPYFDSPCPHSEDDVIITLDQEFFRYMHWIYKLLWVVYSFSLYWYSKCRQWTGSISITWEFVWNAKSGILGPSPHLPNLLSNKLPRSFLCFIQSLIHCNLILSSFSSFHSTISVLLQGPNVLSLKSSIWNLCVFEQDFGEPLLSLCVCLHLVTMSTLSYSFLLEMLFCFASISSFLIFVLFLSVLSLCP